VIIRYSLEENDEQNLVYNPKKFFYFVSFAESPISKIRKVGCYLDFVLKRRSVLSVVPVPR